MADSAKSSFMVIIGIICVGVGIATGDPFLIIIGLFDIMNGASISTVHISELTVMNWVSFAFLVVGFIIITIGFLLYRRTAMCIDHNTMIKYRSSELSATELATMTDWFGKKCNYKWRVKL